MVRKSGGHPGSGCDALHRGQKVRESWGATLHRVRKSACQGLPLYTGITGLKFVDGVHTVLQAGQGQLCI